MDPPYPVIREALDRGAVIPFLGAGASMDARPIGEDWTGPEQRAFAPRGAELAAWLAQQCSFPPEEPTELAKVAQYFEVVVGRPGLEEHLRRIFDPSLDYGAVHRHLASIEAPLLIMTTNYDDMLERAFDDAKRPYDLVIHAIDPESREFVHVRPWGTTSWSTPSSRDVQLDTAQRTVIYKMHGSCSPGVYEYVISEDDYIDFLTRMSSGAAIPDCFAEALKTRPFLFLGYGLGDWNFRVLLNRLKSYLDRPVRKQMTSWAIQARVSDLERRLWIERRVELFELSVQDFTSILAAGPKS
jgi:hypothetical protein